MFRSISCSLFALLIACGGGGGGKGDVDKPKSDTDDRVDTSGMSGDRRSRSPGDDEDDDGIHVKGIKGRLDTYDIQAGVKPHQSSISRCFFDNTKKKKYVSGEIKLDYTVQKDGSVKKVRLIESELGAWPVEKCILQVARKMTFAKPKGGPEATFTLPLSFPKQTRRTIQWWEEAQIEKDIEKLVPELKTCATEASVDDPSNVWVILYVGTRGQVWSAGFHSKAKAPLPDAWADCANTKITAWQLQDPRGSVAKTGFRYNGK
jgi:hypothetical protein